MGHLVNPISFRLGWFSFWNSTSVVCNFSEYSYLFLADFNLYSFFNWFFNEFTFVFNQKKFSFLRLDLIFTNLRLLRVNNRLIFYFFFFDYNFYEIVSTVLLGFKSKRSNYKFDFLNMDNNSYNSYNFKFDFLNKNVDNIKFNFIKSQILKTDVFKSLVFFVNNFWFRIFDVISFFFRKVFFGYSFNFNVFLIKNKFSKASILSNYIVKLLHQRFMLKKIISKVHREYFKAEEMFQQNVVGYKIICSGRFDRKKRATYFWKFFGNLPFSSVYVQVDYHFETVILKYGLCAIKVYIFRKRSNSLNLYFPICNNYVNCV